MEETRDQGHDMRHRTIIGYTWTNWSRYFCKTWTSGVLQNLQHPCRVVHVPDIYTSRQQMGGHGKDAVKVKITIEEET